MVRREQVSLFSAAAPGWGGMVSGHEKHGIEQLLWAAVALCPLIGPCGGFWALRFLKQAALQGQLQLMGWVTGPYLSARGCHLQN